MGLLSLVQGGHEILRHDKGNRPMIYVLQEHFQAMSKYDFIDHMNLEKVFFFYNKIIPWRLYQEAFLLHPNADFHSMTHTIVGSFFISI